MKTVKTTTLTSILTLSLAFLNTGLVQAQNFGLINQKPEEKPAAAPTASATATAKEGPKAVAADHTNDKAALAYSKAQSYITNEDGTSKYTLGPNDVIEITVQRHPEVSGKYIINMEGKIQFEFVGDVKLVGMTKDEAKDVIAKSLEKYIIKPDVTVVISEYNSKVVYVVGEVGAPGKIYMRGDTITVRDALLAANLPQLTAATDSAVLFTPSDSGKVAHKKVNVYALLYEGDLRQNYVMKPGDTIYLPATLWAKVARFINPVTQPIGSAAGTAASVHAI